MKRQLFAIHDGRAVLSVEGTELNHLDYMIEQGILTGPLDAAYEQVVRGFVQHGELRICQGTAFTLPERTCELLSRLRQISHKLKLDKSRPVRVTTFNACRKVAYVDWRLWTADEAAAGEPLHFALHNGESVL
jgi:hypothetical protein